MLKPPSHLDFYPLLCDLLCNLETLLQFRALMILFCLQLGNGSSEYLFPEKVQLWACIVFQTTRNKWDFIYTWLPRSHPFSLANAWSEVVPQPLLIKLCVVWGVFSCAGTKRDDGPWSSQETCLSWGKLQPRLWARKVSPMLFAPPAWDRLHHTELEVGMQGASHVSNATDTYYSYRASVDFLKWLSLCQVPLE